MEAAYIRPFAADAIARGYAHTRVDNEEEKRQARARRQAARFARRQELLMDEGNWHARRSHAGPRTPPPYNVGTD
jgi:hypothetical protein